ncbi:TPA: hypothetical protein ACK0SA_002612 [Staphylococcus aureus]
MINTAKQMHIKVSSDKNEEMQTNAKMVDDLFEIDANGFIKEKFIELFNEEKEGSGGV